MIQPTKELTKSGTGILNSTSCSKKAAKTTAASAAVAGTAAAKATAVAIAAAANATVTQPGDTLATGLLYDKAKAGCLKSTPSTVAAGCLKTATATITKKMPKYTMTGVGKTTTGFVITATENAKKNAAEKEIDKETEGNATAAKNVTAKNVAATNIAVDAKPTVISIKENVAVTKPIENCAEATGNATITKNVAVTVAVAAASPTTTTAVTKIVTKAADNAIATATDTTTTATGVEGVSGGENINIRVALAGTGDISTLKKKHLLNSLPELVV